MRILSGDDDLMTRHATAIPWALLLAAILLLTWVGSAGATPNLRIRPQHAATATQAACTSVGIDLECTANPGDQLVFALAIEVGTEGFNWALHGLQWDSQLQDQLDLVNHSAPVRTGILISPTPPPVILTYVNMSTGYAQPWESSPESPGQTGHRLSGSTGPPEEDLLFAGVSFAVGHITFAVKGSCPTTIEQGVTTARGVATSSPWGDFTSVPWFASTLETLIGVNAGEDRINSANPACTTPSASDSDGDGAPDTVFGAGNPIATSLTEIDKVMLADVDNDGDNDVLAGGEGRIAWFENIDGLGTFGAEQFVSAPGESVALADFGDIDKDDPQYAGPNPPLTTQSSDNDILALSSPDGAQIFWYENLDSAGNFGAAQAGPTVPEGGSAAIAAASGGIAGIIDFKVDLIWAGYTLETNP
ncbi:MAG: FG-GAP-like repeat-containing protein, partial [Myxococcota bacterium]